MLDLLFIVSSVYFITRNELKISSFLIIFLYKNKVLTLIDYVMEIREKLADSKISGLRIFDIINFSYNRTSLLNNLSFEIEPNKMIAIVGETASVVNEILLNRYLYEQAKDKEEKIFYLSKEIENYFTSVFKQTMYTEFERDLYHTKLSQNLIPEVISEKYFHLLQNYYGNDFVYDDISKFEWPRLGHIYRWSYYPYKYATGLLISSNVVSNLIDKKTITKEQYLSFLSAGNSMYSSDLLRKIGIDITKKDVFQTSFQVLENDIAELSKLLSHES